MIPNYPKDSTARNFAAKKTAKQRRGHLFFLCFLFKDNRARSVCLCGHGCRAELSQSRFVFESLDLTPAASGKGKKIWVWLVGGADQTHPKNHYLKKIF